MNQFRIIWGLVINDHLHNLIIRLLVQDPGQIFVLRIHNPPMEDGDTEEIKHGQRSGVFKVRNSRIHEKKQTIYTIKKAKCKSICGNEIAILDELLDTQRASLFYKRLTKGKFLNLNF